MAKILCLNGPNLNRLGTREPDKYGTETLDSIGDALAATARSAGHQLSLLQSNAEHELIDAVHGAGDTDVAFILLNPAAFTHTSIALRDALLSVSIPFIEIHLSNVYAREPYRAHSYFSDIALGVIRGLGAQGYSLALAAALTRLTDQV
jgi:3-dehydroquinate dehydratase-2